jgi:hypothetical protein
MKLSFTTIGYIFGIFISIAISSLTYRGASFINVSAIVLSFLGYVLAMYQEGKEK